MLGRLIARARRNEAVAAALRLNWRGRGRLACRLVRDRRVPLMARLIIPLLVLYLASPIDLVPDFIPVLGQLDDVLVVMLALWAFTRLARPGMVVEISEELEREGYGRGEEGEE